MNAANFSTSLYTVSVNTVVFLVETAILPL